MSTVPGRLTHAYIVEARDEDSISVVELAAIMLCSNDGDRPCRACSNCRKVFAGIHPDLITISRLPGESGTLRREIIVTQIREMTADAPILPNEAERKVYLIQEADCMNTSAQNALLKLLEEPPVFCSFILAVENIDALLPTVRSRCSEIHENSLISADYTHAEKYLSIVERGDLSELLLFCIEKETLSQSETESFIAGACALITDILSGRKSSRLSSEQGLRLARLLSRCEAMISSNVAIRHIWGLISARTLQQTSNPSMK